MDARKVAVSVVALQRSSDGELMYVRPAESPVTPVEASQLRPRPSRSTHISDFPWGSGGLWLENLEKGACESVPKNGKSDTISNHFHRWLRPGQMWDCRSRRQSWNASFGVCSQWSQGIGKGRVVQWIRWRMEFQLDNFSQPCAYLSIDLAEQPANLVEVSNQYLPFGGPLVLMTSLESSAATYKLGLRLDSDV